MKKLLSLLILLLSALCMSCDKDEPTKIKPFLILDKAYEATPYIPLLIGIHSGNNDYSIKVEDENILTAELLPTLEGSKFDILVKGKNRGKTTIRVTDNVTRESEDLAIKVTSGYMPFSIIKSSHKTLINGLDMFIVDDEYKTCVFYNKETDELAKGSYHFSLQNDIPYLSLTYTADENGFTDATVAPVTEQFNISDSDSTILMFLLEHDYFERSETRMPDPSIYIFDMKGVDSDVEINSLFLMGKRIPAGVID